MIINFDKPANHTKHSLQNVIVLKKKTNIFKTLMDLQQYLSMLNQDQTKPVPIQLKQQPINYGQHQYWDQRYLKQQSSRFQWLQNFDNIQTQIEQTLLGNKQSKILNIGCGNSQLPDKLYEVGYRHITSNDISSVVIEQMNKIKKQRGYEQLVYQVMDVRKMSYGEGSFDMVIDKSTIDSLMCSNNPIINVAMMLQETYRVLKPNGYYICISYGGPSSRMQHLNRQHIKFNIVTKLLKHKNEQGEMLTHYLYQCRKLQMDQLSKEKRQAYYKQLKELQEKEYPPL